MELVLHLGAHRTATTSFQHYVSENAAELRARGVVVWGPSDTRDGLLTGVLPVSGYNSSADQLKRAKARIALRLAKAEEAKVETVLISDENMIGAPRRNLRDHKLYAAIGERMARYNDAFDGRLTSVSLTIRAQDTFWASVMSFAVMRGHKLPSTGLLRTLSQASRTWRDVITDLSCAVPGVKINVMPFETIAGLPEMRFAMMTGKDNLPLKSAREWLNRAPDLRQLRRCLATRGGDVSSLPTGAGRWQPFDSEQLCALKEAYADDLFWLRSGAEGLAELNEETWPETTQQKLCTAQSTRGHRHGKQDRRLA